MRLAHSSSAELWSRRSLSLAPLRRSSRTLLSIRNFGGYNRGQSCLCRTCRTTSSKRYGNKIREEACLSSSFVARTELSLERNASWALRNRAVDWKSAQRGLLQQHSERRANIDARLLLLAHATDRKQMQKVVLKTETLNTKSRTAILAWAPGRRAPCDSISSPTTGARET